MGCGQNLVLKQVSSSLSHFKVVLTESGKESLESQKGKQFVLALFMRQVRC